MAEYKTTVLESELQELVSERMLGDRGLLDEYMHPGGVRAVLGKLARGWLIERARSRRLREKLAKIEADLDGYDHLCCENDFEVGQSDVATELLGRYFA